MATDYISREAAILTLLDKGQRSRRYKLGEVWELNFSEIREAIATIPAADVRPVVHGGWKPNPRNPYWLDCTVCGYAKPERMVYNFCPNCGADMREVDADG